MLAHKYTAKFDKDIVICSKTQKEIFKLTKKEFEDPRITYLLAKEDEQAIGIAILSLAENSINQPFWENCLSKKNIGEKELASN